MGIAKRHIGYWNLFSIDMTSGGDGDVFIGESGAPDSAQSIVADDEFFLNVEALANRQKGLSLAIFGTLAVADVQRGCGIVAGGESGANAGVHASAEKHDGAGFG